MRRKNASATPQNYLTRLFGQLKHARTKKEKSKVVWDIELEDGEDIELEEDITLEASS